MNPINQSQKPPSTKKEQLTSDGLRDLITVILLNHDLLLGIGVEDLDGNALSQGNERKIGNEHTDPVQSPKKKKKKAEAKEAEEKKTRQRVEPETGKDGSKGKAPLTAISWTTEASAS